MKRMLLPLFCGLMAFLSTPSLQGQETLEFYALSWKHNGRAMDLHKVVLTIPDVGIGTATSVHIGQVVTSGEISQFEGNGLYMDPEGQLWATGKSQANVGGDRLLRFDNPLQSGRVDVIPILSGQSPVKNNMGLAKWDASGSLLFADAAWAGVHIFDPVSGSHIHTCESCPAISKCWGIEKLDNQSNQFYAIHDGNQLDLYSYNPGSCSGCNNVQLGNLIGSRQFQGVESLTATLDGTLYGIANDGTHPTLIEIDKNTGAVVNEFSISNMSTSVDRVSGLAFIPKMSLGNPLPGVAGQFNSLKLRRAEPFTMAHFTYGFSAGLSPIPNCSTKFVEIANATVFASVVTDFQGEATLNQQVSAAMAGRQVYLQALQIDPCQVSNLVVYTFQLIRTILSAEPRGSHLLAPAFLLEECLEPEISLHGYRYRIGQAQFD
ncbi:MAG: hypothetical protein DWQ01_16125 [Planctomycetota bacterium]|nr:MAG: hypothetical protein DWQ01_16125 [Planctomycetota bacterium]